MSMFFVEDTQGRIVSINISPQNTQEQRVAEELESLGLLDTGLSFGDKRGKPKPQSPDIFTPEMQAYFRNLKAWYEKTKR